MIKVNFATIAPEFTIEDNNRRLFLTQQEKDIWKNKHFTGNEVTVENINMQSVTTTSIKANMDDLEQGRNTQYLYLIINGFTYYYFVNTVTVVTADTDNNKYLLEFDLTLDSITTYLNKVQFKGSTKVKRTHWDRFRDKVISDFNQDSGVWNNEPDIDCKPSIRKEILPFEFADDSDKVGVEEYFKYFAINKVDLCIYGVFNGDINDNIPLFKHRRNIPYYKLIAPLTGFDYDNDKSTKIFNYYNNKDFDIGNSIFTKGGVVDSPKLVSILTTNLPLNKRWENYPADNDQFPEFEPNNSRNATTLALGNMSAEYNLIVKNPIFNEVNRLDNKFNPNNETKLLSSQFMSINIISPKLDKKPLINEYIINDFDNMFFNFRENITSTNAIVHFRAGYRKDVSNLPNDKIDFVNRDQLPSLSSPFLEFEQSHQTAFKTGMETNRIQGILGAISSHATGITSAYRDSGSGIASSLEGGMIGAVSSGINTWRQEKMYKAQITDLKNTPIQDKGTTGTIISDWDNIAYGVFDKSVINFGIEVMELSDIDKYNVAMHLNKYGYETEKVFHLKDIKDLKRRERFTYWECADIHHNIVKGSIPVEILEEFTNRFANGVRLWSVNEEINNYELENWEL